MSRLYGWGASVVILGALFKIMHWPYADPMLIIGMGTEVVVFFFSAFEPMGDDPDWSLVYPELAGGDARAVASPRDGGGMVKLSAKLDTMLEDANIGPELLNNLGRGLKNLSDNAGRLADISNAAVATNLYIQNLETASKSVVELNQSYQSKAAYLKQDLSLSEEYSNSLKAAVNTLKNNVSNSQDYTDQLHKTTQNLATLNAAYELQLKNAGQHSEATEKLEHTVGNLVGNLNESIARTQKYQEEMDQLTGNIRSLNSVYGNMLSAMSPNR